MPIRPDRQSLYPGGSIRSPEWLAIRAEVQARAGDCCEGCGVANGAIGVRLPDGSFMPLEGWRPGRTLLVGTMYDKCWSDVALTTIRIVCTVAHVDRELVDHSLGNLRFWCQRCHNSHDAHARAQRAAATRQAKRPVTLLDLMQRAPTAGPQSSA